MAAAQTPAAAVSTCPLDLTGDSGPLLPSLTSWSSLRGSRALRLSSSWDPVSWVRSPPRPPGPRPALSSSCLPAGSHSSAQESGVPVSPSSAQHFKPTPAQGSHLHGVPSTPSITIWGESPQRTFCSMAAIPEVIGSTSTRDARALFSWCGGTSWAREGKRIEGEKGKRAPGLSRAVSSQPCTLPTGLGGQSGRGWACGVRQRRPPMWLPPSPLLGAPSHSKCACGHY